MFTLLPAQSSRKQVLAFAVSISVQAGLLCALVALGGAYAPRRVSSRHFSVRHESVSPIYFQVQTVAPPATAQLASAVAPAAPPAPTPAPKAEADKPGN